MFVSSLEVLHFLQQQQCPLPLAHLPLSLPSRYKLPVTPYPKQYDILLAGRGNPFLLSYLTEYCAKFPEVEFLQQTMVNDELHYVSNKRGLIGKFHSREEYMNLLRASKVSFYTTPGVDGGEVRTGGFNPVTPRFLELLSAQCLLLGRYPDNEETRFFEVSSVCPHVDSYAAFEETLTSYLQHPVVPLNKYEQLLQKHYTSRRVEQLQEVVH